MIVKFPNPILSEQMPAFDFESIRKYAFKYDKDTHDHTIESFEQLALSI